MSTSFKLILSISETIGVIDALQDVSGKKLNLIGKNADKATGTLLRRLLSNAQSRVNLLDVIDEIETVAKKFSPSSKGGDVVKFGNKNIVLDDDLLTQVLFADELDSVFGPVARTSFQGQIEQGIKQAARGGPKAGAVEAVVEGIGKGAEKLRGINEEAAFRSIRNLLKE